MRLQPLDVVGAVGGVEAEPARRGRGRGGTRASIERERRVVDVLDEVDGGDRVEGAVGERREVGDVALREADVRDAAPRPLRLGHPERHVRGVEADDLPRLLARGGTSRRRGPSRARGPGRSGPGATTRRASRFRSAYLRGGFVNQWRGWSPSK